MKSSTYLSKELKDQLLHEDLEYIDTLHHGSTPMLKEMVASTAMRIIESRKYPKETMNIKAGRDVNMAGRDVCISTNGERGIIMTVLIGLFVTVIGGIILYAVTRGF